jgi:hypothetical protein
MPKCAFVNHTRAATKKNTEQDHLKENRTLRTAWRAIRETIIAEEALTTHFINGLHKGQMCPHIGCGAIFSREDMVTVHHRKAHPYDHQQVKVREAEGKYEIIGKHDNPAIEVVVNQEEEQDDLPLGLGERHTNEERR